MTYAPESIRGPLVSLSILRDTLSSDADTLEKQSGENNNDSQK